MSPPSRTTPTPISPLLRRGEHDPDVRIAAAVREILDALGEDPDREGLRDTPQRVARALREMTSGLGADPGEHLRRVFHEQVEDLVMVRDLDVRSLCEHHLLPFVGVAHIAYVPAGGRVVGLSKLARTVETLARRPQVQERLTAQIADAVMEHLQPRGVSVMLDAEHYCMIMRGVENGRARTTTVAHRGEKLSPEQRAEMVQLLRRA
jgi:GTP cyclohydrolase I